MMYSYNSCSCVAVWLQNMTRCSSRIWLTTWRSVLILQLIYLQTIYIRSSCVIRESRFTLCTKCRSAKTSQVSTLCLQKHFWHFQLYLENQLSNFNNFWHKYSWHNLPSKDSSVFLPYPRYASELPRESKSSEVCVEMSRKPESIILDIIDRNMNKN